MAHYACIYVGFSFMCMYVRIYTCLTYCHCYDTIYPSIHCWFCRPFMSMVRSTRLLLQVAVEGDFVAADGTLRQLLSQHSVLAKGG